MHLYTGMNWGFTKQRYIYFSSEGHYTSENTIKQFHRWGLTCFFFFVVFFADACTNGSTQNIDTAALIVFAEPPCPDGDQINLSLSLSLCHNIVFAKRWEVVFLHPLIAQLLFVFSYIIVFAVFATLFGCFSTFSILMHNI